MKEKSPELDTELERLQFSNRTEMVEPASLRKRLPADEVGPGFPLPGASTDRSEAELAQVHCAHASVGEI